MDFPTLKKKLRGLFPSLGRALGYSKNIALSAGLIGIASGPATAQPPIPLDPKLSITKTEVTKFSSKYLLKSAAGSLSRFFVQHRSHSSHSSHSSHTSHYSSVPSHSSGSVTLPPPARVPTPAPPLRSPSIREEPSVPSSVVLSDYFNEGIRATSKWRLGSLTAGAAFADSQITVSQQNGRLEITPRSGISIRAYNGYVTSRTWDLNRAWARVDVLQITEGTADTIFAVGTDSNNWYGFVVENGKLYMQSKINGRKNSQTITYDATEHRSLRLRHEASANQILWETSQDGQTWTSQRSASPEISLAAVYVTLSAGTYMPETEPGLAVFDNFQLVVPR